MIITLLAWLYITVLCWIWGSLLLGYFTKSAQFHFSLTCLTGLAGITVFSSVLSLVMPLGGWLAQFLLLAPCIFFFLLKPSLRSFPALKSLSLVFVLLLTVCVLLLLFMSTWTINNEDTLAYHAQIIQWIERYKAVPGIANLHVRYGLQSSWFTACALFAFRFLGTNALTFLNSTVLLWYFIFMISQLNKNYSDKKNIFYAFGWLGILLLSLWSYAQVRLTATSGSPDFSATLYCWLSFYLVFNITNTQSPERHYSLLICISIFTITLKLSAAPIIFLSIYGMYKLASMKKIRTLLLSLFISMAVLLPFAARNSIATGYPAFPSIFPDVVNVDWKLNKEKNIYVQKYITAYARTKSEADPQAIDKTISMKMSEWLPTWWKNQSLADKSIILLVIFSLCILLIGIRKLLQSPESLKISLAAALAGVIFWFVQAPDPRFGFGFIIALIVIIKLLYLQNSKNLFHVNWKNVFLVVSFATVVTLGSYTVYRAINFFSFSQLLSPAGIQATNYKTITCDGITLHIPETNYSCGDARVPCAYDSCQTFEARGNDVADGFRAK